MREKKMVTISSRVSSSQFNNLAKKENIFFLQSYKYQEGLIPYLTWVTCPFFWPYHKFQRKKIQPVGRVGFKCSKVGLKIIQRNVSGKKEKEATKVQCVMLGSMRYLKLLIFFLLKDISMLQGSLRVMLNSYCRACVSYPDSTSDMCQDTRLAF